MPAPSKAVSLQKLREELSSAPYQAGFDEAGLTERSSMLSVLGRDMPWEVVQTALAAVSRSKQCRGIEVEHALQTAGPDATSQKQAEELLQKIILSHHLCYLSLRWLPCASSAWTAFSSPNALGLHLQVLELERCKLKGEDLKHVCTFIKHQPSLLSLSLAHNPIGVAGAKAVLEAVLSSGAALEELSLAACSLSKFEDGLPDGGLFSASEGGAVVLATAFGDLLELNLSSNRLQGAGLTAFQPLFEQATCLETLNLRSNAIGSQGSEALHSVLGSLGALKQVDIGGNQLQAEQCEQLGRALAPSMQSLDLSNNAITSAGLCAVLGGLGGVHGLKKLDVSRCKLCHIGMEHLAAALMHTPDLTHLSIADNKVHDAGIAAVLASVDGSSSLEVLDLTACSVSDASESALLQLAHHCDKLQRIRMGANKLSASSCQRIQAVLGDRA